MSTEIDMLFIVSTCDNDSLGGGVHTRGAGPVNF